MVKISLGDYFENIEQNGEIPRGQSGSLIDEIKIGKEYYIRKNMPSNKQDWGSFKRELIAMKLFQGELHVLVPKYIIISGIDNISFDNISDRISLAIIECSPCRQTFGNKTCVDIENNFTWNGINMAEKDNLVKFLDQIVKGIESMHKQNFYHVI